MKILRTQHTVSSDVLLAINFDDMEKHIKNQIAYNLTEALMKEVTFTERVDWFNQDKVITAEVVVMPKEEYDKLQKSFKIMKECF
jgi:sulfur relay (sulfurtransferase) complex TusBCD TusD component (DsrE family)